MTTAPSPNALTWSDTFLLGYGPMDDTHREFVDCVHALQTAPDAKLLTALQAVCAHCESHFAQEHRWMEETDMPGRDCHADEHAAVMRSLQEVVTLLSGKPSERDFAITRSLAAELARWFPAHADQMDSALSHWMSKKRFGGKPMVIRRNILEGSHAKD